ncbi:hypothetical protein FB45DRAFT_1112713 [Roridomyces roridus]|uniref:Uncharacterized protein n=1 Tax=Roridomyces roridus TaxID=1738132 RepID=A0AAD7FAX0_9AGAR|nr:hypothetical protein FB45DRAFT_1112713 [Roridomyces roridus]
MSENVTVIIDDSDLLQQSLSFTSSNLGEPTGFHLDHIALSCYNNTLFIPFTFNQSNSPWNWPIQFDGVSVALFGVTPPTGYNQTIHISDPVRDGTSITDPTSWVPYTYPAPAQGGQFLASGMRASDQLGQIGFSDANGLSVDYILVTASNETSLRGQTILVDDTSLEISWNTKKDDYNLSINYTVPTMNSFMKGYFTESTTFLANMPPHGNSTHSSNTMGDSFTFQFAGTSLLISGVTPGPPAGINTGIDWFLEMEFTLDGDTNPTTITAGEDIIKPHFVYFNATNISSGNHTFSAKISNIGGLPVPSAQIDYITHAPSFATIAEKPNFSMSPSPASSLAPSLAPSLTPGPAPKKHHDGLGAIVGGVVGGCVALGCLVGLVFWLLRRQRRNSQDESTSSTRDRPERARGERRELSLVAEPFIYTSENTASEMRNAASIPVDSKRPWPPAGLSSSPLLIGRRPNEHVDGNPTGFSGSAVLCRMYNIVNQYFMSYYVHRVRSREPELAVLNCELGFSDLW